MEYFLRLWPLLLLLLTTGEKMTALISTTVRALLLLRNLNFWTYYIRSVRTYDDALYTPPPVGKHKQLIEEDIHEENKK